MIAILNNTFTIGLIITILFGGVLAAILLFLYARKKRDKLHHKEIQIKNSEIELLKNKNKELKNLAKQLETSSKAEVEQWLKNSEKVLQNLEYLPEYEAKIIQEEIKKRQKMTNDFSSAEVNSTIAIEEIEGTFSIIGLNQNKEQNSYNGFLHLTKTGKNRVTAEWVIGGEQTQVGVGFYNRNTLIINFSYEGEDENRGQIFKGVVAYKFINDVILTGFWSEKHGNDSFLGFEEGRKINNSESISYQAKMN